MEAYLNDSDLKDRFVSETVWHREQDMLIRGTYGEETSTGFRGCAIGCAVHSLDRMAGKPGNGIYKDHARLETDLGIPEWLARVVDKVFEGLPVEDALVWPSRFAEAVPVGPDLNAIRSPFLVWLMQKNLDLVETLDMDDGLKTQVLEAIRTVKLLHETPHTAAADAAYAAAAAAAAAAHAAAAGAAARNDARAARNDAAADAAYAAADAAEAAAEAAADAAAGSAGCAAAAAGSAHFAHAGAGSAGAGSAGDASASAHAAEAAADAWGTAFWVCSADQIIECLETIEGE